jgi:hypothetical protein
MGEVVLSPEELDRLHGLYALTMAGLNNHALHALSRAKAPTDPAELVRLPDAFLMLFPGIGPGHARAIRKAAMKALSDPHREP